MTESANSLINKSRNLVSRNRPVAIIANSCTFVGASLAAFLLEKGIQIVAIDDLSTMDKSRVEDLTKNKDFHIMNFPLDSDEVLEKISRLELPRLDYGFFITDKSIPDVIVGRGIVNFVEIINTIRENNKDTSQKLHGDRPRLAFVSSINLYGKSLGQFEKVLKEAEVKFAKGVKHYKLNGRIIRLSEVYGPKMDLSEQSPLALLIEACVKDKLDEIPTSMDFTERSLFIDDAISLLAKSVLSGATSNKIFDGALLHPIKLSEIKQILIDPMWFEEKRAEVTKLPAWPTPNLVKTIKELSWSPKTSLIKSLRETVAYFKEHQSEVPEVKIDKKTYFKSDKSWSFAGTGFLGNEDISNQKPETKNLEVQDLKERQEFDKEYKKHVKNTFFGKTKRFVGASIIASLLIYGLLWPFAYLGYEGFMIRQHLLEAKNNLEVGDFNKSEESIQKAQGSIDSFQNVLSGAQIVSRIPGVSEYYKKIGEIVNLAEEGVDGVSYATSGSKSLFETTKIISGESRDDPREYYQSAQKDLDFASDKLSKVQAGLENPELKQGMPTVIAGRIDDLKNRVEYYQSLVEQTKSASEIMPKITGLEGKKSYLVLIQNNLELRPTGGFIGSYAKLDFDNGRLTDIKVDDIYNLDGALKDVIAPPAELKSDLGVERLYLRDSNFEPDFPTAARQASFFYKKEAGETVHGVIALDLKASGNLLDAIGGLDLPEYGESVNGANLFERIVSHAEVGFFPGSQAKKNYLTSLQNQMFNKIFYLSKQNWPGIIQALGKSLEQKHMLVYLEDPSLFSYLASSNWSGVFPREGEKREGETNDFLAVIESNMGANKANYYLERKYNLNVVFSKEGKVGHELKITYKNTSPGNAFPAGRYKNRVKIYTPLGSKLNRAMLGETDITSSFTSFSDYGRTGFSALIEIQAREQKQLVLDYELADALNFKGDKVDYKLEVFKQPGTMADPYDFVLNYPINYKLAQKPQSGSSGVQEVKIQTDLLTDKVFQFKVTK